MPEAGRFRERVTFRRAQPQDDGYGNIVGAFADHLTVWADVLETLGREKVAAGAVQAPRTATVRVRYSAAAADLTTSDVVVARGRGWNIRSIVRVGRKAEVLEMLVESEVAS